MCFFWWSFELNHLYKVSSSYTTNCWAITSWRRQSKREILLHRILGFANRRGLESPLRERNFHTLVQHCSFKFLILLWPKYHFIGNLTEIFFSYNTWSEDNFSYISISISLWTLLLIPKLTHYLCVNSWLDFITFK